MKKKITQQILLLCTLGSLFFALVPVSLQAQQAAIAGFNTDTPDGILIVVLRDFSAGESFYITDGDYVPANNNFSLSTADFIIEWTAPAGGLTKGSVFKLSGSGMSSSVDIGSISFIPGFSTFLNFSGGEPVSVFYSSNSSNPNDPSDPDFQIWSWVHTGGSPDPNPAADGDCPCSMPFVDVDFSSNSAIDGAQYSASRVNTALVQFKNTSNWTTSSNNITLDCTPFTNIQFGTTPGCSDAAPPSITCPSNITQSNDAGQCDADVTFAASATDDCTAMPTITYSQNSGTAFLVGTTAVTATATDDEANTATCSFNVTVNDTEPPLAACPPDITRSNDAGQCGANVLFSPTIGDNCPGVTASSSPMSGSFFDVGTTSVTVTSMDVAGNTATCSFNVTVNDTEKPTITCPANLTVSTSPGGCTYNLNPWGTLPTSDNCSSAAYVEGTAVFGGDAPAPYNLGVNTVTFTVWDEAGNTGTCSFDITVEDNTTCGCANPQPGDTCDDMDAGTINDMIQPDCTCMGEVPCDINITGLSTEGETCPGSSDGRITIFAECTTCTDILYSINGAAGPFQMDNEFTNLPSGINFSTYVKDSGDDTCNDNSALVSFGPGTDDEDPVASCPADITEDNDPGQCEAVVTFSVSATDNCTATAAADMPSGSSFPVGTTSVVVTATDGAGNTSTCTFNVTVGDNEDPVPVCKTTTVDLMADGMYTLQESDVYDSGLSTDNCSIDDVSFPAATYTCAEIGQMFSVTVTVTDAGGTTASCDATVTVAEGDALPDEPIAATSTRALCQNADLAASLANTGVNVSNSLTADEKVVWVLTSAPAGSAYMAGDEFTTPTCGDPFENFGELAVANTSKVIRVQTPGTAPVGTYTFDAYIENCATGCTSDVVSGFSITIYEAPSVSIMTDPDGDLCLGQMDVEYSATITSTDGGTYTYAWCAYNSGDGSGTCFNGFDDNTAAMPTRDWTSSAGSKSVGVTVTSDVAGCEAEGLYSFEVVAPTILACPMDMMGILITDDVTFDCAATFNWNHPEVMPGPCDPVTLTITISGGSVSEGPTTVTPGDPYTFTFEELGEFTVTYDLIDVVGNTSTCSFTITVDGLPCGFVDNGGIGCADDQNSSSFDSATETFTVTANNCALTGWPYSSDQLAFVFSELCGDGEIIARVTSVSGTGFGGVMMRDSEDPSAPFMAIGTNRVNKVLRQVRTLPSYPAFPQFVLSYDQFWVRIVRSGNQFMGFASTDGVAWIPYLNQQVFMSNNCLRVGLFTYSEKPGNPITATFDNVFVTGVATPLAPGGQTLEVFKTSKVYHRVNIYPNPASSQITLEMDQFVGQQAEIRIFNQMGQLQQQARIDEVQFNELINVSALQSGVYNVVIRVGDQLVSKRLVIARP